MKLTPTEAQVLACVRFQGRTPVPKIASQCGLRAHTVSHALSRLKERGIIVPYTVVNVHALGLVDYGVFLSGVVPTGESRARLISRLKRSSMVPWVVELAGKFQLAFSLVARSPFEVDRFLLELGLGDGDASIRKAVCTRLQWHAYGPRYISECKNAPAGYVNGGEVAKADVDELDMRILRGLSLVEAGSLTKLARIVGEPLSTVEYRVRGLERRGVIVCCAYAIDSVKIGAIPYLLLVYERGSSAKFRTAIAALARTQKNIVSLTSTLGPWSYELGVDVFEPAEVSQVCRALGDALGEDIQAIDTLSILQCFKLEPLPAAV